VSTARLIAYVLAAVALGYVALLVLGLGGCSTSGSGTGDRVGPTTSTER